MNIKSLQSDLRKYEAASWSAAGDIAAESLAIAGIDAQLLCKNAQLVQARSVLSQCEGLRGRAETLDLAAENAGSMLDAAMGEGAAKAAATALTAGNADLVEQSVAGANSIISTLQGDIDALSAQRSDAADRRESAESRKSTADRQAARVRRKLISGSSK